MRVRLISSAALLLTLVSTPAALADKDIHSVPTSAVLGQFDREGLPLPPATLPDPGSKAQSPEQDLRQYPKLPPIQGSTATPDASAQPAPTVELWRPDVTGGMERIIFEPAPGVTAGQLADDLKTKVRARPGEGARTTLDVVVGGKPVRRVLGTPLAGVQVDYNQCTYGWAMQTCPISYWANWGAPDPQVGYVDHTGSYWITDQAVYSQNQTVGVDSYYRWGNPGVWNRYVDLWSGNYGATGWIASTGIQYYCSGAGCYGRFKERWDGGAPVIIFNDYYGPSYWAPAPRQGVPCHEMAHTIGLQHSWSSSAPSCIGGNSYNYQYLHADDRTLMGVYTYGTYRYP